MGLGDFSEDLSLANVCAGKLEADFQNLYPKLVATLKEGNKASISITLEMEKVPNTDTMVNFRYQITPKFPARKKESIVQLDDGFQLHTEKVPEKVDNLRVFPGGIANAGQ